MDNRTIEEVRRNEDRLIDKNIELENINDKLSSGLTSAENKLDLYKSVLDEIREYIKNENYKDENICVVDGIEILQILDKNESKRNV